MQIGDAYFTGPNSSILALVSVSRGVEARTQTPPLRSLMAVERPPKGMTPNLLNGLQNGTSERKARHQPSRTETTEQVPWMGGSVTTYLEKIQTSFATSRMTVSVMAVACGLLSVLRFLACKWTRLYREL